MNRCVVVASCHNTQNDTLLQSLNLLLIKHYLHNDECENSPQFSSSCFGHRYKIIRSSELLELIACGSTRRLTYFKTYKSRHRYNLTWLAYNVATISLKEFIYLHTVDNLDHKKSKWKT